MAGGTWKAQNKVRPGVYINVKGDGKPILTTSIGRLLMFQNKPLGWGENGVITLDNNSDFEAKVGHKLSDPIMAPIKEALKGAETVLLVNATQSGVKAAVKNNNLPVNIEAKYEGIVGNNLKVSIEVSADSKRTTVTTLLGTKIVDQQKNLSSLDELQNNYYINFTKGAGTDPLTGSNTYQLEGGVDGTNNVVDVMNEALEKQYYAVATTAGWDEESNIHELFVEQIKRLRENVGIKVRGVVPNSTDKAYNYEGVSGVKNGYILNTGDAVDVTTATARFAGLSASASAADSLTYTDIDDAIEAKPRLNNEETINALLAGEIVFTTRNGNRVVIEQDLDSLTKFNADKPKEFSKNKIIRVLDEIATNTQQVFETSFLGRVGNDDAGRNLFKANRVAYLQDLQNRSIIQNFAPADLEVLPGEDSDAVVMNLNVQPVDAMEKLYVTITVS